MFWLALISVSFAHKPSFGNEFISAESAFEITDPDVSIVVYQTLTCENSELWMTFDVDAGKEMYVQVGVPVIDRLTDFRPNVAIVAPGLDADDEVPFAVPDGMTAMVFESESESVDFYEPFTQTDSWIYIEETVTIPSTGSGFIVAWNPENITGKVWVSTGTVEDFSDSDMDDFIYWGEAANNFHETGRYEIAPTTIEENCALENDADAKEADVASGCSHAKTTSTWWAVLLGLVLVRRNDS